MDPGGWSGGETLPYHHLHRHERPAVPAHYLLGDAAESQPPPARHQQAPSKSLSRLSSSFCSIKPVAAAPTSAQCEVQTHLLNAAELQQPARYQQAPPKPLNTFSCSSSSPTAGPPSSAQYEGQTYPYRLQQRPDFPTIPHVRNAAEPQQLARFQQARPPRLGGRRQLPPSMKSKPSPTTSRAIGYSHRLPPPHRVRAAATGSLPVCPPGRTAAVTSAQYTCRPCSLPWNASPIPGRDATSPASSHLYEALNASAGVRIPQVDVYAPEAYVLLARHSRVAVNYEHPPVGSGSCHRRLASSDAQDFSANAAIQEFGFDPIACGNVLGRPPKFSTRQNPGYKKNKKIAKVVRSAYCEVCKVDCNSQEVLISHRQGKKHKKNVEKLKESLMPKRPEAPTKTAENKKTPRAEKGKTAGEQTKRSAPITKEDLGTKKRRLLEEGTSEDAMRVCTVCNIVCNSEVVFQYHIAGQKHIAMAKKQAASIS